jgi:parallel beta-helix repeat protein
MFSPTSKTLGVVRVRLRRSSNVVGAIAVMAVVAVVVFVPASALGSSPIVVTNTSDSGAGSLRQAILAANTSGSPSTIVFNIPTSDPGFNGHWFTIAPLSPLPALVTSGTVIDGSTQTTFSGDTNLAGPEMFLDGRSQVGEAGLSVRSSSNVVEGLTVSGFPKDGISIDGGGGNVVRGNYVGTDPTGTAAIPNGTSAPFTGGVNIQSGGTNTLIGGTAPGAGNVISGNGGFGVFITGSGTIIQGNLIGTDATGMHALGNAIDGIAAPPSGLGNILIGGTALGAGNVISGNGGFGVISNVSGTTIQGNLVGTNSTGSAAIPNGTSGSPSTGGIAIQSASTNTLIGGTAPGAGNVISGNVGSAVNVCCSGMGVGISSSTGTTIVQGNLIGTDSTGMRAIGNAGPGIVGGGASTLIGGTAPDARNVISGNGGQGVSVFGSTGTTIVQGNLIGTDSTGMHVLGNGGHGIGTWGAGANTLIGGTASGAGNVISGNGSAIGGQGVSISASGTTIVQGNLIGTDSTGMHAIANANGGIGVGDASTNTLIGGTAPGAGNVISGNGGFGVGMFGSSSGTIVQSNDIGTNPAGTAVPNTGGGIIVGSSGNQIETNTIAYNSGPGVGVYAGTGNSVSRNSIFSNGGLGIDLGFDGVTPNDPDDSDTGPNNLQNFPVLTSALVSAGQLVVQGTIDTPSPQTDVIEFFANPVPVPGGDPSGYGEGAVFLGTATPAPDGTFSVVLPPVAPGTLISATATDAAGNTSEFAKDIVALALPTSTEQCKKGGWQTYGVFKNQGDCVSYVATKGKNGPNG